MIEHHLTKTGDDWNNFLARNNIIQKSLSSTNPNSIPEVHNEGIPETQANAFQISPKEIELEVFLNTNSPSSGHFPK